MRAGVLRPLPARLRASDVGRQLATGAIRSPHDDTSRAHAIAAAIVAYAGTLAGPTRLRHMVRSRGGVEGGAGVGTWLPAGTHSTVLHSVVVVFLIRTFLVNILPHRGQSFIGHPLQSLCVQRPGNPGRQNGMHLQPYATFSIFCLADANTQAEH
jgi:hypothetical protein